MSQLSELDLAPDAMHDDIQKKGEWVLDEALR